MQTRNRPLSPQAIAVLNVLADHASSWRYGLELSAETGLKSGSLYPILMRMAERGLLESCWQESSYPGRPPRHAYRITAQGRAALTEAVKKRTNPKFREALA
jgi:DNA-binding PadR family transcriptional regulator